MGYRRKSKESAVFETLTGLAAVVGFLWLLSPGFRYVIQVALLVLLIATFTGFVVWFSIKLFLPENLMSPYGALEVKSPQVAAPFNSTSATIRNELQSVQFIPELTISEKLRKIDWFQFEKLIELIYQHRGFSVKRLGGANADGGVDLIVKSPAEEFVIQCKHWRKWTVGVRHIREFLGALTDSGIPKGIFITLVGYSDDAKKLADKHGIQILEESDIVVMLVESGLMYSKEISKLFADERKFCPKCEREMVLRTGRVKGNKFWGCSNFPHCRFILNIEG